MRDLALWLSPHESRFQTAAQLVAACKEVNLPGHRTVVLIPTLYDDWPQQVVNRSIGDELAIDSPDDAWNVRAAIEFFGVPCGGWSVPRGTGNVLAEGYKHGLTARYFDHFSLNFEAGWQDFWAPDGRWYVDEWFKGFNDGLQGHRPQRLGVTFVTNTAMLQAVSASEGAAWFEQVDYVGIEVYLPGDPGLDPARGTERMRAELAAAGHPDLPIVCILEQGDLPALAQQFSHPDFGVQVWTVQAALNHAWPAPGTEEPATEPTAADFRQALAYLADITRTHAEEVERVARQYGAIP